LVLLVIISDRNLSLNINLLAFSPYRSKSKSRSLSKSKGPVGSSGQPGQSPRPRDKTSGKQRIQKMRDAAEAAKSSVSKKEYKSFTVTTKPGTEIPHKVAKDFLSSRSVKTLNTPKLKEREASGLMTTAPVNISSGSTNVNTMQYTNTSIVSSRKQPYPQLPEGPKIRTKRLSNIPTNIDVSNNLEIVTTNNLNLSAKDSVTTVKSRKAYINQIYSQILKKHLGGRSPGQVPVNKVTPKVAAEKKIALSRPATATAKVTTNLLTEAKRRKETAAAQTKKEMVHQTAPDIQNNEEQRVPIIKQEVLRPKTVAKFKRSDTLNIKKSSNTNLNIDSPVVSARAQSKEPVIQQRRVTATTIQARTNSVAQITSSKNPHSLNNFKFERVLGQGAYAVVKLAMDKIRGEKVAVKIYEKHHLSDPRRMKNVRREISILQGLDHPNIIKLHDSFDTPKQIHMVMEYVAKTSLHSYLRSLGSRRLTENEIRGIMVQICQGLSYCHGKNIIHRDVKLENILLNEENNVKLIDFGFSIIATEEHKLNIYCGTPSYMAPEIAGKVQYKGGPTDVWSVGIILFILLCGFFPFKGSDDRDLFAKIKKGKYEVPEFVSKGGRSLIKKILKVNPDERLKINEILEDNWMNERDQ